MDCSHDPHSWPNTLLSIDRRKAMEELLRGREVANQLRNLLGKLKSSADDSVVPVENLVIQILQSFASTLSMLSSGDDGDEASQMPVVSHGGGPKSEEDSGGESSRSTSTPKDRRGCYKRRKTQDTYMRMTPDLIDDGYAWRKYGQKVILDAEFPRNYFRCTHKYDQECQATKQVQQIRKEPSMYRTTYHGHHTCKDFLKAPQIIFESNPPGDSSKMLCFETNTNTNTNTTTSKQETTNNNNSNDTFFSWFTTSTTAVVKHECKVKEEIITHNKSSPSSDYIVSPPPLDLTDGGHMKMLSPDHNGDVISGGYSCTTSSHSFEFDDVCNLNFVGDGYYYEW